MVIVVVDKLTKRSDFIPSRQVDTAPDVARRFFEGVVRLHGMPSVIISDRDPKFTSLFRSTLFECFVTRLAMSSANHPQSDG
jgi:transposase-like protein